jgi:hypothetical protein
MYLTRQMTGKHELIVMQHKQQQQQQQQQHCQSWTQLKYKLLLTQPLLKHRLRIKQHWPWPMPQMRWLFSKQLQRSLLLFHPQEWQEAHPLHLH